MYVNALVLKLLLFNFLCLFLYCRLQVVSTNVGGIPEVLPNDLILLAEPNVSCKYILFALYLPLLSTYFI